MGQERLLGGKWMGEKGIEFLEGLSQTTSLPDQQVGAQ